MKRTIGNNTIVFAYDGWKPVIEYDGGGNMRARNIYGPGPDEILMRGDSIYGWFFYHADKQGSVTALVGGDGTVVEKYSYDAFGRPTVTDWWDNPHYDGSGNLASWYGNRFMFTGREWLSALQLYDYRHRLYNPDNGRFLQTDPMGLQTEGAKLTPEQKALYGAGAPEAFVSSEMNLYRYCGDDPVDRSDPLGLVPPGEGLLDVPKKMLEDMFKASEQNVGNTATKPAYDPNGKPVKQEFRTTNFTNGSKEQPASTPGGYHPRGSNPTTPLPKDPFKGAGRPTWDTHSHISGSGRPYGHDKTAADNLRVPMGVQSATEGPVMHLYVPSTRGGGGGEFWTPDGKQLFDYGNHAVPH